MRLFVVASALSVLALVAMVVSPGPATAAKSKMGCEVGTEVWDAAQGKCQPGAPKYKKKSAEPAKAPVGKAAAAGKKAPAAKKTPAAK